MRRIVMSSLFGCSALLLALPLALAQSGVVSGSPQVSNRPNNFAMPPVEGEERNVWIAVAAGFDGRGKNVGVGFSGHRTSRADAESAALNMCNARGKGIRCREAYAVPTGCLYIVPGGGRSGVTWGRGATPEVALDECRRGGYGCDRAKVIGGCVAGNRN
jgi:hypothetical protein